MEIYTVGQVTRYIKETFETDDFLQDIWIEGEVSNYRRAPSGHAYFTLKDATSQINCVMFRSRFSTVGVAPENGLAVIAHGRISVYEVQGTYQLYVDLLQPEGVGALHLRLQQLRSSLEREGLFDPARKRPLPQFPQQIGVVTSLGGAVLHDIIQVVSRRYPLVRLLVAPTLVQGDEAGSNICTAIQMLNECPDVDVIIVARGGGSLEELWPFNEEQVARAIFASRIPVVTGIGHETDFTIADWVADCRAPTPSAAAEMVVPDWRECQSQVSELRRRLFAAAVTRVRDERTALESAVEHLQHNSPASIIDRYRQRIDDFTRQMNLALRRDLNTLRARLDGRQQQLESLNPLSVLARGYSICRHDLKGITIKSLAQVTVDDPVSVQVTDGIFQTRVVRSGPQERELNA